MPIILGTAESILRGVATEGPIILAIPAPAKTVIERCLIIARPGDTSPIVDFTGGRFQACEVE